MPKSEAAPRKESKPEPHLSLARLIRARGLEGVKEWADQVTREERLERAVAIGPDKERARAEFLLAEGEEAYIDAAIESGMERQEASKAYSKREAF